MCSFYQFAYRERTTLKCEDYSCKKHVFFIDEIKKLLAKIALSHNAYNCTGQENKS